MLVMLDINSRVASVQLNGARVFFAARIPNYYFVELHTVQLTRAINLFLHGWSFAIQVYMCDQIVW